MSASPTLAPSEGRESWIPMLQLAAQEVFELMLNCKLTVPAASVKEEGLDITAMVGLAGQLCGMITVRCKSKSAARMASSMLGIDVEKAGPEIWDAMGEICNMVAGNFKNKIPRLGDGCMLSVPTVITGADYNLHSIADAGILHTTLLFQEEPVILSLQVHS